VHAATIARRNRKGKFTPNSLIGILRKFSTI